MGEDGVRHRRGRRVFVVLRQHDVDAVGGQHFECTGARRHRQRVRVDTEEERAIDPVLLAVPADGLPDREDMPFVEGLLEGGPRCPEVPKATCCPGIAGSGTSV
jgi:hypothetical protein